MDRVKEPIIKVGDVCKDYNGHEYKVIKVSNVYDEVSKYDEAGACVEYSTDAQLIECDLDPTYILYCAVEKEFAHTTKPYKGVMNFVFLISRYSKILGE